jgi:hypothetical protein
MAYIQWKVKAVGYTDTWDNEPAGRRDYGKMKAEVKEEGQGYVEFWAREQLNSDWQLIMEFRLEPEEEEEEEEEEED